MILPFGARFTLAFASLSNFLLYMTVRVRHTLQRFCQALPLDASPADTFSTYRNDGAGFCNEAFNYQT
jgi:hypothetical protein